MFWASFRVGMTTLMDAPSGAAEGLEKEFGGWVEMDKRLTTSLHLENSDLWTPHCRSDHRALVPSQAPGRLSIGSARKVDTSNVYSH